MVSRRQRLRYIDSSGTEQVIGEIAGPGDEKGLSRGQVYHRAREYDKTVARGDVTLKENLPQDNTEFQGDVPEIFFETYDPSTDSWTTRFRGFLINGGLIDRNNEVKALLFDMVKYHGGEEVSVNISSLTTNVDIMKDAVSNLDVVIDHPTETDVQNNSDQDGFVEYDGYTKRGARKEIIREQTRVTGWALKPTGSQDGNGNWIWRYEPVGYGGTVDTIKDKSVSPSVEGSIGIIREWGFSRKKNIINKVELINTEDDGSQVVGSYSAASEASPNSVDKYGERYENFQVGFLSSSKANELAEKIVNRNKNPKEGGNLKAQPRYEGNEANNSFEIRSEQKGIDGVFTATEQINHYPETSTDFTFEFERETEGQAALAENLRQERRKLYPSTGKGLSGETGRTQPGVNGNTGETGPDVAGDTGSTGPNVSGNTSAGGDVNLIDDDSSNTQFTSGLFDSFNNILSTTANVGFDGASGMVIYINAIKTSSETEREYAEIEIGVTVNSVEVAEINGNYPTFTLLQDTDKGMLMNASLWVPATINDGDDVSVNARGPSGGTQPVAFDTLVQFIDTHDHGDGTLGTDNHPHDDGTLDTDSHPHSDGTLDTDNHPHSTGTLEAETAEENKTDRP